MKKLYQCSDRVEAQLLKDHLISYHIETVLHGDYLAGAAGELSAFQFPELWLVDERDYDRARQLIDAFLQRQLHPDALAWTCAACGADVDAGFDLCWNCTAPRGD